MQKDISQKKLEDFHDVFADIFNALLFDGKPVLSEESRNRLHSDFRLLAEYAACEEKEEKLETLLTDSSFEIKHPEAFLDALSAVAGDSRYQKNKTQIQNRDPKKVVTMCVLAEKLERRGIELGREEGIAALIIDYVEDGRSKPQILDKLELRFQLSREKSEYYYHKYAEA